MGITTEDLSGEMAADESIRLAAQRKNVIAIGWDPTEDRNMIEFSIGLKVDDDGDHIIHAVGSLVMNVLHQMSKDDIDKELKLTADVVKVIALRQAGRIAAGSIDDAMLNGVTS